MAERVKLDAKRVIIAVLEGDLDGHAAEFVQAVRQRVNDGAIKFAWRVEAAGLEITEENLTVGEAKLIEEFLTHDPVYVQLDDQGNARSTPISIHYVAPAGSAVAISAIVTAAMMCRSGLDRATATKTVEAISIKTLLRSVSDYTVADPPKESGDQPPQ